MNILSNNDFSKPIDLVTLDLGNSTSVIGLFENESKYVIKVFSDTVQIPDVPAIACTVSRSSLPNFKNLINVKDYIKDSKLLGLPIHYSDTIGIDRLVVAHKVHEEIHNKQLSQNVVVIDVGTYMTIDFVNLEGFQGGYIIPGPTTVLNSFQSGAQLKEFGLNFEKLPDTSAQFKIPDNTFDAMISGTQLIFISIIQNLTSQYPKNEFMITGGGSNLINDYINTNHKSVQTKHRPNLIHESLYNMAKNHILNQ
jgi:pantothenate kinase type III